MFLEYWITNYEKKNNNNLFIWISSEKYKIVDQN